MKVDENKSLDFKKFKYFSVIMTIICLPFALLMLYLNNRLDDITIIKTVLVVIVTNYLLFTIFKNKYKELETYLCEEVE